MTVDWSPNVQPHTSRISCSRVNAWPGLPSRKVSRSSSRTVRASSSPSRVARRAAASTVIEPAVSTVLRAAAAEPVMRRSTESTRSTSSRGENGLVT